jgi:hypothetical protein
MRATIRPRRCRQVQRAALNGSDLNPVRIRDLNDPFEIPHIPVQAVGVPAEQSIEPHSRSRGLAPSFARIADPRLFVEKPLTRAMPIGRVAASC